MTKPELAKQRRYYLLKDKLERLGVEINFKNIGILADLTEQQAEQAFRPKIYKAQQQAIYNHFTQKRETKQIGNISRLVEILEDMAVNEIIPTYRNIAKYDGIKENQAYFKYKFAAHLIKGAKTDTKHLCSSTRKKRTDTIAARVHEELSKLDVTQLRYIDIAAIIRRISPKVCNVYLNELAARYPYKRRRLEVRDIYFEKLDRADPKLLATLTTRQIALRFKPYEMDTTKAVALLNSTNAKKKYPRLVLAKLNKALFIAKLDATDTKLFTHKQLLKMRPISMATTTAEKILAQMNIQCREPDPIVKPQLPAFLFPKH